MAKQKVYLIDLGTGTDRSLLPLSCGLIESYCRSQPDLSENYDFSILMLGETLDHLLEEIESPAVLGIACYVWNFLGSQSLSRAIKERYPECLIVWGGPSIPQEPANIHTMLGQHPYVDILVHLEGELTFAEILRRRLDPGEFGLADCKGVSYRDAKSLTGVTTELPRERIKDFTAIPSPFLNGTFDRVLARYGDHIVGALWETSRGCPFRCSFCDWGNATVNKVNRFEVERVLEEIDWVSRNRIHYVYATDANFGISSKRDLVIAKGFIDIASRNGFPDTLVLNWTKNSHQSVIEIADVLMKGGVITNTTLSTQSFHEPTLAAIQRENIRMDVYRSLKKDFHDRDLPTYTELILALPEETLETYRRGINLALSPRLQDQLSIYLCVILENTQLKRDMQKYGIETRKCAVGLNRRRFKYPRFGEDEIVVGTSTMPVEDWMRGYKISFALTCLYNLRVAFYPIIYLWLYHDVQVTDTVEFLLDTVSKSPEKYPAFARAFAHLEQNCQRILDGVSSVMPVEGGGGVSLTPHEAMTFLFFSHMDETYRELPKLLEALAEHRGLSVDPRVLADVVRFQRVCVPVFDTSATVHEFETDAPFALHSLAVHGDPKDINVSSPCEVTVHPPAHSYATEMEYNLRRVACGYTLNLSKVQIKETGETASEIERIPLARNLNLMPSF